MFRTAGAVRHAGLFTLLLLLAPVSTAVAQAPAGDAFLTAVAEQTWEHWSAAMRGILDRDSAATEKAFGDLLDLDPSPFRVALLARRTVDTPLGGALLLFEQDVQNNDAGPNGAKVGELLKTGQERVKEAGDAWFFCQVGRFDIADANFRALLDADPDPVAILEFAEKERHGRDVLIQLVDNPTVGESVRRMLDLLNQGEAIVKADPTRIQENIQRLGGPPRGFENAVQALRDSGEYAVPFLIQSMQNQQQKDLLRPILLAFPSLDRPALNPLVIALRMRDAATDRYLIEIVGKIGYGQAVPYLLQLRQDPNTVPELKPIITQALDAIAANGSTIPIDVTPAEAYYRLAEQYYNNTPELAADPRLDEANVWYWRSDMLVNTPVPTPIFNEVMAMRCCTEALRLDPGHKSAIALWLAANFRRAAQLPAALSDPTRPENFPSPAYFAEVAGAEYCLLALARAVDDNDPAVALGAIDALRKTAGTANLITDENGRLPLAEALSSPNRMVRVRAGLALANARPRTEFTGYQNLMPVLSEALMLHGGARNALVVDADQENANTVAGALRGQGYEVLIDANLYEGLRKIREELPGIDVIFLASDIASPDLPTALRELRGEFRFAATPVVVVTKPGDVEEVQALVRADHRLTEIPAQPRPVDVAKAVALVLHAVGAETITPDVGAALALDAAQQLATLALTENPIFHAGDAESALLATLSTTDATLHMAVVDVLSLLDSAAAQQTLAAIALDASADQAERVRLFAALATSAKRNGNLLSSESVNQLVTIAARDENLDLREAASAALGALSVTGEPASEIIRSYYQG